ncbi:type II toxin-antitoxin system VapC family toxin [Variovorax sp. GT1P44]|uniref:type II toxin-antitoxin system VapC family toxin n=1 Tax=Variovorax sp. GT1P44 TaxID=3443742 RepID=UPI003F44FA2C
MNSVLLDTSFLISFSDPTRTHHATAQRYYRECVQREVPLFLSTIAISEFQVRQAINDLPLRNFVVLPFNVDHAMACGLLLRANSRDAADDRARVKDDFKLIAQCQCEGITHLLSEDAGTLAKYMSRTSRPGPGWTSVVLLKDGFDASWFENGQSRLIP